MLWFPKDFFNAEYREDFLVDSTMKCVWAAEMEVLAKIAEVCEKYQLQWFAEWGTLLGTVRHNGFIPWDDDMDICLKREDYEKLMKVLPSELPDDWVLHHSSVNDQDQFWACVMNASTISVEKKRLEAFHNCPFIVGIDIFPLDYLPRNKHERKLEESLFVLIWKVVRLYKNKERTNSEEAELLEGLDAIDGYFKTSIDRKGDVVTQLWKIANDLCMSFTEADGDYLVGYLYYVKNHKKVFKKEWYEYADYLPFENVEMAVPQNYHEVLTTQYGDYSVRLRNTAAHDYPFYNKQLEFLRKEIEKLEGI